MVTRIARVIQRTVRSLLYKAAVNASVLWTGRWIAPSARLVLKPGARLVLGRGVTIREYTRIIIGPASRLEIGDGGTVDRGCEITAVSGAEVTIGSDTYIGNYCNIRSDKFVHIGRGCYLAQFVSLIDGGYDLRAAGREITREAYKAQGVRVGENAWLGVGCILLPGVSIGDGSVVGAGAVVTKDVPARAIVVGNPAHVIAHRPGRADDAN